MVDVRGPVGASHAIQDAIRAAITAETTSPQVLAGVLARVLAEGFPLVDVLPLFAEPDQTPVTGIDDFPADLFAVPPRSCASATAAADTTPLFDL